MTTLARPEQFIHYGDPAIHEIAAAYAFGLAKNYPVIDGNKRTDFAAAFTFLAKTGYRFNATEVSVVEKTLELAAGAVSETDFAELAADKLRGV